MDKKMIIKIQNGRVFIKKLCYTSIFYLSIFSSHALSNDSSPYKLVYESCFNFESGNIYSVEKSGAALYGERFYTRKSKISDLPKSKRLPGGVYFDQIDAIQFRLNHKKKTGKLSIFGKQILGFETKYLNVKRSFYEIPKNIMEDKKSTLFVSFFEKGVPFIAIIDVNNFGIVSSVLKADIDLYPEWDKCQ